MEYTNSYTPSASVHNKSRCGRVTRLADPTGALIEKAIHVQCDRLANNSLLPHEREQVVDHLGNLRSLYRSTTGHDSEVMV